MGYCPFHGLYADQTPVGCPKCNTGDVTYDPTLGYDPALSPAPHTAPPPKCERCGRDMSPNHYSCHWQYTELIVGWFCPHCVGSATFSFSPRDP